MKTIYELRDVNETKGLFTNIPEIVKVILDNKGNQKISADRIVNSLNEIGEFNCSIYDESLKSYKKIYVLKRETNKLF